MSLKRKLSLYESYVVREEHPPDAAEDVSAGQEGKNRSGSAALPAEAAPAGPKRREIPYMREWEAAGVRPYFSGDGYCLIRETSFPLDRQRGRYRFSDFFAAMAAWQEVSFDHPLSGKGYRPEQLFFFDIETTGLTTGAGNTIFLLGYAFFSGDRLILRQHFLPEPGQEIPLYESFLKSVDYRLLVTYNGKAFDWPQVKTQHALIREHLPKLPKFGHFDLYHGSRRLWKHRLDSVRLTDVERDVLGIEREEDVPGHLAPMIYYDFLETKRPEGILKIMEHNEKDILTLVPLYTHLSFQLLDLDPRQTDAEKLAAGRWYASLKEIERAVRLLEEAAFDAKDETDLYELSLQYKRLGEYGKAMEIWEYLADEGGGKHKVLAAIEAAKYLEHQKKDAKAALDLCRRIASELAGGGLDSEKFREDLARRILRLEKKAAKQVP